MHQRASHLTDFYEISYWGLPWKCVEKFQIFIYSGKTIRHQYYFFCRRTRAVFQWHGTINSNITRPHYSVTLHVPDYRVRFIFRWHLHWHHANVKRRYCRQQQPVDFTGCYFVLFLTRHTDLKIYFNVETLWSYTKQNYSDLPHP